MIRYLSINNLMLIEKIDIDVGLGLCVLTGETGAGKSMILESIDLLSGRRIKSNIKPDNGKRTVITALIDISNFQEIKLMLRSQEIIVEDEIIIKRIIETDGKSKAFVNDNLVGLGTLKEISNIVLEVHSQFSEQGLLDNSTHIRTLDDFGEYNSELKELKELWSDFKEKQVEFAREKIKLERIQNKRDEYAYDLKELKNLDPKKGEFIKLEQKKKVLQNSRKINENLKETLNNFLREEPPGIEKLLTKNIVLLNQIRDLLDDTTNKEIDKLDSISIDISETFKFIEDFLNKDIENESLENIDERITSYKKLSQKHSINVDDLNIKIDELSVNLGSSESSEKFIKKLFEELNILEKKYYKKCEEISEIRKRNALVLDKRINSELPELKLENAEFKTSFFDCEFSASGKDKIIFTIKTNPKSKFGEIKDISSGGELCRIALAIKVTAEKNNSSTMVFDEVDSGIGGAVSTAVGERLRKLGKNRQVLVVTHSPQVASLGASHFLVKKNNIEDDVKIEVNKLSGDEKINEIARMLSGKQITREAIDAAKKLIENSC